MAHRSIKSAERTLALFELFSSQERSLTVGEISRLLEIPQPSVTMLLRNLLALGYLEHDPRARTYSPTIRIALLGSWIHRSFVQERQLEWRLKQLFNAVEETTYIALQNGVNLQYILFLKPLHPNRFDVQAQSARPLARASAGKALLSLKPDDEVRALVRRYNAETEEARLKVDLAAVMKEIADIRMQGFAESHGGVIEGIATIAMPVRPLIGQSPLAVAVGGPEERIEAKRELILDELRKFVLMFAGDKTEEPGAAPV